jgi:diguanylate cyclase (GGDEF)-like protein
LVIGRDEACDLVVEHELIAPRHAVIEMHADACVVTDLHSQSGTYVNDVRVASAVLQTGDCLRVGNHVFRFLGPDHIEAQYHETAYSMMTRDGLTGAYNRRYLMDVLARELERTRRCRRPLALLLADIDHFKAINDTYGHFVGDEVLCEFCRRTTALLRPDDVFARCGGEEFALVMWELTMEMAIAAADRVRRAIQDQRFDTDGGSIQVTASFGVAVTDGAGGTAESLLQLADDRLYRAKLAGRNRVCWE